MKRYYNVTGEDRKRMVSIIGEVIGEKPYYLRMPTCGYKIGAVTVTKDGTMIWDGRTSEIAPCALLRPVFPVSMDIARPWRNIPTAAAVSIRMRMRTAGKYGNASTG